MTGGAPTSGNFPEVRGDPAWEYSTTFDDIAGQPVVGCTKFVWS